MEGGQSGVVGGKCRQYLGGTALLLIVLCLLERKEHREENCC